MERYDGPLFDCDNHYYEAEDAFTRHVPQRMQRRCVQWVEMNGKRHYLVAGKLNHAVGNPTFNPISKPGALREYYRGNPEGKSFVELTHGSLEPRPPEYMDRDAGSRASRSRGSRASGSSRRPASCTSRPCVTTSRPSVRSSKDSTAGSTKTGGSLTRGSSSRPRP